MQTRRCTSTTSEAPWSQPVYYCKTSKRQHFSQLSLGALSLSLLQDSRSSCGQVVRVGEWWAASLFLLYECWMVILFLFFFIAVGRVSWYRDFERRTYLFGVVKIRNSHSLKLTLVLIQATIRPRRANLCCTLGVYLRAGSSERRNTLASKLCAMVVGLVFRLNSLGVVCWKHIL